VLKLHSSIVANATFCCFQCHFRDFLWGLIFSCIMRKNVVLCSLDGGEPQEASKPIEL